MTYVLRKNCCDPPCPSSVEPCDECEEGCTGTIYTHGYYFNCAPETSTHGYYAYTGKPQYIPWDCWDEAYTSAIWLYDMSCDEASTQIVWEWADNNYTLGGYVTESLHGPHATEISAAGRMNWDASICAYENNDFVLRGVDANGKRFKQNLTNDNYSLVDDSTAPTLTLDDGTVLYTIETMSTYDQYNYSYDYFGETVFINTDDTEFIQTSLVDSADGYFYGVPDWVFTLRDFQIIPYAVKLSSTGATVNVPSGWNNEALFCETLNTSVPYGPQGVAFYWI